MTEGLPEGWGWAVQDPYDKSTIFSKEQYEYLLKKAKEAGWIEIDDWQR